MNFCSWAQGEMTRITWLPQVRGNSQRSLTFESAASGSTAFTDALEALDPALDPEAAAAASVPRSPASPASAAAQKPANAATSEAGEVMAGEQDASRGEGGAAAAVLTSPTSMARRRAQEWEQRLKVSVRFAVSLSCTPCPRAAPSSPAPTHALCIR